MRLHLLSVGDVQVELAKRHRGLFDEAGVSRTANAHDLEAPFLTPVAKIIYLDEISYSGAYHLLDTLDVPDVERLGQ